MKEKQELTNEIIKTDTLLIKKDVENIKRNTQIGFIFILVAIIIIGCNLYLRIDVLEKELQEAKELQKNRLEFLYEHIIEEKINE